MVAVASGLDSVANPKAAKMLVMANGMAAAAERDMNAERQRRSLAGYVLRGMHAGGAPYGYRSRPIIEGGDGPEGTGKVVGHELVIHEGEAEVVRRVFRLFAEGKSSRQIANLLNAEGVPPPGARWKNRTTRVARTWSHTAIASSPKRGLGILNQEKYIGRVVWNRTTWPQDPDTRAAGEPARAARGMGREGDPVAAHRAPGALGPGEAAPGVAAAVAARRPDAEQPQPTPPVRPAQVPRVRLELRPGEPDPVSLRRAQQPRGVGVQEPPDRVGAGGRGGRPAHGAR